MVVRTHDLDELNDEQMEQQEVKKRRRKRKPEMSPQKKLFLRDFISSYEIETTYDLQEALKDLLGDTIKELEMQVDILKKHWNCKGGDNAGKHV